MDEVQNHQDIKVDLPLRVERMSDDHGPQYEMTDCQDLTNLKRIRQSLSKQVSNKVSESLDVVIESLEFRQIQNQRMDNIKIFDKFTFTFTFVSLIFFFFYLGHDPTLTFVILYTILVASIFVYRILYWPSEGNHLYLFEFCYFANILTLVMIYFYPDNMKVWHATFTSASGVIALAAAIFKNRVAFSSIDQMHSLFLHALPPVYCYMVRWKDDLTSNDVWGFVNVTDYDFEIAMDMLKHGLIFYAFWVVCYTIIVQILSYEKVESGAWSTTIKDLAMLKGKTPLQQRIFYSFIHFGTYLIGALWSLVIYSNRIVNLVYLIILFTSLTWNGACYYIDHFSMKYMKKVEKQGYEYALHLLQSKKQNQQKQD